MAAADLGARIAVVGNSGSGKTTVAARLARALGCPHVELDALYWGPNWTAVPVEEFHRRLDQRLSEPAWVADGNYWGSSAGRHIRRAQTLVWLDYPLRTILWRLLLRIIRRGLTREELWSGNREVMWRHFFTRDSLLLWALGSHGRRRRLYAGLTGQSGYEHLRVIRLRSPSETRRFLASLEG